MKRLLALAMSAGLLAGQEPRFTDPQRKAKLEQAFPAIDQLFERYFHERGIPGMVYGIVIDGQLAHVKTWGVRDRQTNDAVTPETAFRIASMTKSFTALAILKLRDEGKLSLEDPASKYIPEIGKWKLPTADSAPILVRNLMTHGAGFPEDNPWGDRQLGVAADRMTEWLKAGLPFSTSPDTAYEYSNYGFALLGRIVTKVSGVPYREYVEKNILAPLGMKGTSLEPSALPVNARAMGYKKAGDVYQEEPSLPHGAFGAMGGMVTTANDLGKYVAYQMAAFPPRNEAEKGPVRRSSQREQQRAWRTSGMTASRTPNGHLNAFTTGYGYGLGVARDCRFNHIVSHGGGLPGFGSYMAWLPEYGVGMFAMTNLTYSGPSQPILAAFDEFRKTDGLEARELPPSPALLSTRDAVVRLWNTWSEAEAQKIAADNLFLDTPAATRQQEIARIKAEAGTCGPAGDMQAENWLRGRFRMKCDHGHVDVMFTLAPTNPPKVQFLRFTPAVGLNADARAAAERVAGWVPDKPEIGTKMDPARALYGQCRVADTLSGNGRTEFRVRLECEHGPVEAAVKLDEQRKVSELQLSKPADAACTP